MVVNVSIRMDDVEKLKNLANTGANTDPSVMSLLSQISTAWGPINIGPGQSITLGTIQLPETDKQSYNIYITARNGSVKQLVRFRLINGEWVLAYRVETSNPSNAVKEYIHHKFPRDEQGQISW
jgi:hypothetical protein